MKAVLLNDTRNEAHWGCLTVIEAIETHCKSNAVDLIASAPLGHNWEADSKFMEAFKSADCIIVNGEGTIHSNRPAGYRLLRAGPVAKKLKKKSALMKMTWQNNGSEFEKMARDFDLISVRESASASILQSAHIACHIIPDLAMSLKHDGNSDRQGIGFTDNVLGASAYQIYKTMWRFDAELIPMFYGKSGWDGFVFFLRRFLTKSDIVNPAKIAFSVKAARADTRKQCANLSEFVKTVSSKSLIVTGRFHMMIYALATQTPFLVLKSNTHKNEATLRDSGLDMGRLVSIDQINADKLAWARQWHGDEQARLQAFLAETQKNLSTLFSDIKSL